MKERLQKVIAGAGICSRREAERLIEGGDVTVNRQIVREMGTRVDPAVDRIEVFGKRIRPSQPHVYLVLHKPRGRVTTAKDPQGRPTVLDLLTGLKQRVFPVGRLDYSAEGLLLMTNDGDLAYALMRPGGVPKTYRVKVKGTPAPETLDKLRNGLVLDGSPLLPVKTHLESRGETSWLRLTLHEGRKNQIVRMMQSVGHPVRRLRRVSIGPLQLGTLPSGRWRPLDELELAALREAVAGRTQPGGSARPPGRDGKRTGSRPGRVFRPERPAAAGRQRSRPARNRRNSLT